MNVIIGYYFFGDFPDQWIWIGLIIIISSGVYISLRENVKKKTITKEPHYLINLINMKFENKHKGLLLALVGVLFITPDSLSIRLVGISSWDLMFYRGLIPFVCLFVLLLLIYKKNFIKDMFSYWFCRYSQCCSRCARKYYFCSVFRKYKCSKYFNYDKFSTIYGSYF